MALAYTGGDTDSVDVSTDASFENQTAFTVAMWLYLDTAQDNGTYFRKDSKFLTAEFSAQTNALGRVVRAGTNATAISDGFWETGKWMFVAFTYDETDGIRLWKGELGVTVAEATYSEARVIGDSATDDDTAEGLGIGNRPSSAGSIDGRVATFLWTNYRATLADLRRIQFAPTRKLSASDQIIFSLGYNGTGTQPDLSGNGNSGAVTGATVAAHAPLPPPFAFGPPFVPPAFSCGQPAFPDADLTKGTWETNAGSTVNLFTAVDETTPNDADYIQVDNPSSSDYVEFSLDTLNAPSHDRSHRLTFRVRKQVAGSGNMLDASGELRTSTGLVATMTSTDISTGIAELTLDLSTDLADKISSFSDLRARIYGVMP